MLEENVQERAHALFEYIKAVCLLNQQKILDVDKQPVAVPMYELRDSTYIQLFGRDTMDGVPECESDKLLVFHKPNFTVCPTPDSDLERWLAPGWDDYRKPLEHWEQLMPQRETTEDAETEQAFPEEETTVELEQQLPLNQDSLFDESVSQPEYFFDDPQRVALFDVWKAERAEWVEHEKHTEHLRDTFNDLFDMYNQFRQSPNTLEIMIGNGLLTDKRNKEIHHPLFLKHVTITLDSIHNTLTLSDFDEPAQMYLPMFSVMEDVNTDIVRPLEKRAEENNVHPLDHHEGGDILKSVAHQLHSSSRYLGDAEETAHVEERILVKWEPYIFLRKRPDGTIKALEAILDAISKGAKIPSSLSGILGDFDSPASFDSNVDREFSIDDTEADWFEPKELPLEDEDILLPKPANREQMQIVRQIERSPAVLVQGPPGTGKTHTIANLLSHFLAEGKTVLVTSHTTKALNVLKDKVPKDIQALCVAVLGDNQADMEESVNAINEYTAIHSYEEQRTVAERIRARRHDTLAALQQARSLVYSIRHKEFEPIVYFGESWSPSKAADYVAQNENLMALIPGFVSRDAAFPLSSEELEWLYASNGRLTEQEETELASGLIDVGELMTPQQLADGLELLKRLNLQLNAMNAGGKVSLAWKNNRYAVINQLTDQVFVKQGNSDAEAILREALAIYEEPIPEWVVFAVADGAEDGIPRKRWEQLLSLIDETFSKSQVTLEEQITKPIRIISATYSELKTPYNELLQDAQKHGRVKKGLFMSKEKRNALDAVTIADKMPETVDEIRSILDYFQVLTLREQLGRLWDSLMASHGVRTFSDLGAEPEYSCHQYRKAIDFWMNWMQKSRNELCALAETAGIGDALLQPLISEASFTNDKVAGMLKFIQEQLLPAVYLLHLVNEVCSFTHYKEKTLGLLMERRHSAICADLQAAINMASVEQYELGISNLFQLIKKAEIQERRSALLRKVEASAPDWAEAIRSRAGCHGLDYVPENLLTAWKICQLSQMVDEIASTPLSDAENRVMELTNQFRKETEKLASAMAWLHLKQRIDQNPRIRQSLYGWKMTMAKIGKGTGKRAPALRVEARKLMVECQKAVPAWIMPISDVMSSINVEHTKFDVIIIDEASQSDITASAILYMGKKIIVVGDNEQVSPMAVGLDENKMLNLMNMLIKGKIPNAHLWDAKTSLYDIAAQVYRPLMLREHFRCVPDIIGYCNMLSYQGRIKPLREAGSSPFKTAMISYRVHGIRRGRSKVNEEEANAIVALIKACIEQPEYAVKSFGIISLLGDDQAKMISRRLAEEIPLAEYERHQILCGNASNFQGDERDVIFLSMVDSNESDGPLAMASGEGMGSNGKSMKQRYNVAVSRAKDQLWVVHSFDYISDLKPGDMRRGLLEYVSNPHAAVAKSGIIDESSDSPFEAEVAKALVAQGYHIVQQWQVGAYYIDMVAICGNKKIAIECDGERWHSGEDKIRQDMERQSILERLGWRFIRIRGSEYYRERSQTISRVVSKLNDAGIYPEATLTVNNEPDEDELLTRVKVRAAQLLNDFGQTNVSPLSLPNHPPISDTANQTPARQSYKIKADVELPAMEETSKLLDVDRTLPCTTPDPPKPLKEPVSVHEQIEMQFPEMDLLSALTKYGFQYVDNRETSGLIWVLYDAAQTSTFASLRGKMGFNAKLEKRGAKATNNKPAWCITGQK